MIGNARIVTESQCKFSTYIYIYTCTTCTTLFIDLKPSFIPPSSSNKVTVIEVAAVKKITICREFIHSISKSKEVPSGF